MQTIDQLNQNVEAASRLLKNLSNPHRLLVLCHLVKGEYTVGELEVCVGLSQSALSQHLAKLREEGIVGARRDGQNMIYRLTNPDVQRLLMALHDIYCGPAAGQHSSSGVGLR